jgi:hypothetical protein
MSDREPMGGGFPIPPAPAMHEAGRFELLNVAEVGGQRSEEMSRLFQHFDTSQLFTVEVG